ncbi:MAG TPA: glycosyltransferase family 2 protein [Vicinamibacterales bacterium]|nr:glycosyltransferase family 2 protein [Vicinamibacterales bacterium]
MGPRVTVIICTRDRPQPLEQCLGALRAQRYRNFDVLVVDNGAGDSAAEVCRSHGVACIREAIPGLTRARNLGARAARGELVAYIDDDAIAEPQWLEALVTEFQDPRVGAVAGRTRYMKAAGDPLVMSDQDARGEVEPRPRRRFDRDVDGWFALACFGGIGDGNTMMFRRELLTSVVRFDERIGRGRAIDSGDEHIAFMSLISDGFHVVHAPAAVVRHPVPSAIDGRQAKRFRDLRGSIAYFLFVWSQFPNHRVDVVRFLASRLTRRVRSKPERRVAPLTVSQTLSAVSAGRRLYADAVREWAAAPSSGAPMARVVTLR